jgi:hypothetical protein
MDLIRRIALETEALAYGESLSAVDSVEQEAFIAHVIWMEEAGLIEANAQAGSGSFAKFAIVHRLTWEGCEFASAIRSDTLWAKAKTSIIKPGTSFTFDLLKDWLKTEITQGFPAIRGLGQ